MKKLVYFLSVTLFIASCGMSSNIHDDVYDKTETKALAVVDVENGYYDYIKKEEDRYKVEPENKNDKKFIYSSQTGNLNSPNQYNDSEHFCFHHQRFHSINLRSSFCDFNTFDNSFSNSRYHNGFDYGGQVCHLNSPYNGDFNHFGNSWAYQGMYPGFYNPYGFNGYGYYAGFGVWNYGYGGNYYGNTGWGGNNNSGNSFPNNIPSSNDVNVSSSGNQFYGHRGNGSSNGTTLNNNTFYPETVKIEMENTGVNLFPVVSSNHVAIASQNIVHEQVVSNNNVVASGSGKVEKETVITTQPVTEMWNKPLKTNYISPSNNYSNYQNKYETTLVNTESTPTTTVRTTDTSRRNNYNTNNSTNSSKTYGSRSTGGTTGSSSSSGSTGSSGSRSGSSRR